MIDKTGSMIADEAPSAPQLTQYDRSHLVVYMRLLDAAAAGADWTEAARTILGLDPAAALDRAKRTHDSHLARARWMIDQGYRDLLRQT